MTKDAAASDAMATDASSTGASGGRDVTFAGLPRGEFAQGTVSGVALEVAPYQGSQVVTLENWVGPDQDLGLECGELDLSAPEPHAAFKLTFNDDGGSLSITVIDRNGQMIGQRPVDTRLDSQVITRVDGTYKALSAAVPPGAPLMGSLKVASCGGIVHEILLQ